MCVVVEVADGGGGGEWGERKWAVEFLSGLVVSSRWAWAWASLMGLPWSREAQSLEVQGHLQSSLSSASRSRASLTIKVLTWGVGLRRCAAAAAGDPTASVRLAFGACVIGLRGGPLGVKSGGICGHVGCVKCGPCFGSAGFPGQRASLEPCRGLWPAE